MSTMLQVEGLSLALGQGPQSRKILANIELSVSPGESFGLVGESGSGKTSLLRCISGQYTPRQHWRGRLLINGESMDRPRTTLDARLVQTVFQDPFASLHPRHTVFQTLAEPLRIHGLPEHDRRVDAALEQVALSSSLRFRYPHQLSGGQRQRVAIARALMLAPPLLLLDEPTSALDVSVQAEVLNLLVQLRAHLGLTYVLVSHDLGVVTHLCNRLAVMQGGQIVETIGTDELCRDQARHPYTRALVEASES